MPGTFMSRFHPSGKKDDAHISYQFNVILREPPGQRINLMNHGAEFALRDDANGLAEFLDKPLLDHTVDSD